LTDTRPPSPDRQLPTGSVPGFGMLQTQAQLEQRTYRTYGVRVATAVLVEPHPEHGGSWRRCLRRSKGRGSMSSGIDCEATARLPDCVEGAQLYHELGRTQRREGFTVAVRVDVPAFAVGAGPTRRRTSHSGRTPRRARAESARSAARYFSTGRRGMGGGAWLLAVRRE
jgi:hypothetical protein